MTLLEGFTKTIRDYCLVSYGDRILVALSGGADSVCLLSLFKAISDEYSLRLGAVYVNYRLRQGESDIEEKWIESLCDKVSIPLYRKDYPITDKRNLQANARKARFRYFKEIILKHNFDKVSLGHHLDDQLETFFMRLMRGASIDGLSSMSYLSVISSIEIIRPLLGFSRSYILSYLKDNGIGYLVDSSNLKTDYLRNQIRLTLYPVIEGIFPSYRDRLSRVITNIKGDNEFINGVVNNELIRLLLYSSDRERRIDLIRFNSLDLAIRKRVLVNLARQVGRYYNYFSSRSLDLLLLEAKAHSGMGSSIIFNKKDIEVCIEYLHLVVYLKYSVRQKELLIADIRKGTTIHLGDYFSLGNILLEVSEIDVDDYARLTCECKHRGLSIFIDKFKLSIFNIRPILVGDRIYLNKNTGLKKVKEILINSKIPYKKRKEVLVLCNNGNPFGLLSLPPFSLSLLCESYYITRRTKVVIRLDFRMV